MARAEEIAVETPGSWIASQFANPANPAIHRRTTAEEIVRDFPEGLDYLITGSGTAGHITGCAEVLKERWSSLKVYVVEPALSPVFSGGEHTPHPIQGIGPGFIPEVAKPELFDGVIKVQADDAMTYTRRAANEEGLLVGVSSGASLAAVAQLRPEMADGSRVI